MKKNRRSPALRTTKKTPANWPAKEQWVEIESELSKKSPTFSIAENKDPIIKTKYDLCEQFIKYRRNEDISQKELSERLGVTPSRVSEILHYHVERFTIDKLLELLLRVRPEAKIKVA